ncbi:ribosome assembly RNA-binding protein YhbY [Veillonella sp.]|uniref:ribosome assembly RNA-binding protein YhbY n=1 Tax=Veillonella sp. TaxID=1926307 RepID=UPI003991EDE9
MTGKQKRFLRALASTMPAVVMIGKGGLEDAVIDSARAAITARELIKVKVLNNAPVDPAETFEELADMLGAELVQVIGHNGVLYKAKKEPKIILPR